MTQFVNWVINLLSHEEEHPHYVWQPETDLSNDAVRNALSTAQMQ